MKTLSFLKKPLYSALVFFGILMVLSVGYATWNATMSKTTAGSPLTAAAWNALVDNITDLDNRWSRVGSNVAFTGGNVGIGTASPGVKLEVTGDIKANNFQGKLNGLKMYTGSNTFSDGSCNSVTTPCIINISGGGFLNPPICTISMIAIDATGYTENMVIQSITSTALNLWKGLYQNEGTTMVVSWICIGN